MPTEFTQLPEEIILEVCKDLSTKSLAAFVRASSWTYRVGQPVLYTPLSDSEDLLRIIKWSASKQQECCMQYALPTILRSSEDTKFRALTQASRGGFINTVRSLLDNGICPDPPAVPLQTPEGKFEFEWSSPLMAALMSKQYKVAELILESGTDLSLYDMEETFILILAGDKRIRQLLIDRGLNIHRVDASKRNTLLHKVCGQHVDVSAIELLLDNGLDINQTNADLESPLNLAIRSSETISVKQGIVRMLLSRGAKLNAPCNALGESPLHIAREDPKMVVFLLGLGADVNASDLQGLTALGVLGTLDFAIYCSDSEYDTAWALIEGGASVETNLSFVSRLIKRAVHSGHTAYIRLLLGAWDAQVSKSQPIPRHTRFLAAALLGDVPLLREILLADWMFLDNLPADCPSPLVAAVRSGNHEAVRLVSSHLPGSREVPGLALSEALAREPEDTIRLLLSSVNVIQNLALSHAVTRDSCAALVLLLDRIGELIAEKERSSHKDGGHVDQLAWIPSILRKALDTAAKDGMTEATALLLQFMARHKLEGSMHHVPLLSAIIHGHEEIAIMIIRQTHALNVPDDTGQTPIINAASRGSVPIVKALIEAGVDPAQTNSRGLSPIVLAAAEDRHDVVQFLMETVPLSKLLPPGDENSLRARINLLAYTARYDLAKLGDHLMSHSDITENILEVYYWAARYGKHHLVQLLIRHAPMQILRLEAHSYRNAKTNQTALIYTASAPEESPTVVKILLHHRTDLDADDHEGRTALSHAVERGYAKTAELLVAAGASITQPDNKRKTPLQYAANDDMIRILYSRQ
ncbi:ankyrin repeat-containing domain protein [Aspergillus pseudoustus]|uniref:Ankyrin repeat-containing domain protein n=1 Tax=Aspergillus pseudoustus TaxID=1810923 RepID=A0ABR4KC36_9EURO